MANEESCIKETRELWHCSYLVLYLHMVSSHIAKSHGTTNETLSAYNSSFNCFIGVRFSTLKEHEPVR